MVGTVGINMQRQFWYGCKPDKEHTGKNSRKDCNKKAVDAKVGHGKAIRARARHNHKAAQCNHGNANPHRHFVAANLRVAIADRD